MADNKTDVKNPIRISLASRMLAAGLRGKLEEAPLDEPWRNKNSKRRSKGKRRK